MAGDSKPELPSDETWDVCWDFKRSTWTDPAPRTESPEKTTWKPWHEAAGEGPYAGDAVEQESRGSSWKWSGRSWGSSWKWQNSWASVGTQEPPGLNFGYPFPIFVPPPPPVEIPAPKTQPQRSKQPKGSGNFKGSAAIIKAIEGLLAKGTGPLKLADFDLRVRRHLGAMLEVCGESKVQDALTMLHTYTEHKSRDTVLNWPAYLLTLIKKFEPGVTVSHKRAEAASSGAAASSGVPDSQHAPVDESRGEPSPEVQTENHSSGPTNNGYPSVTQVQNGDHAEAAACANGGSHASESVENGPNS